MKRIRLISILALCAIVAATLSSCGDRYEDEEIISAARSLIEASYEINDIYFGDGLKILDEETEKSGDEDEKDMKYYTVDTECGYSSIRDIREATLKVYTEEYSEYLFKLAFTGFSIQMGEEDEAESYSVAYARYLEGAGGYLSARRISDDEKLDLSRTYNLDEIKVLKQRKGYATISVPSFVDGEESDDVDLKLKITDDGWRLDEPTY